MGDPDTDVVTPLSGDLRALAVMFFTSGTLHLVRSQVFEPIVPRVLPAPRGLVLASGVAELVCAAGLLHPSTRKAAGWASAAVLLAIFPANVQMALTESKRAGAGTGSRTRRAVALARLPLQIPLIRTALKATGHI